MANLESSGKITILFLHIVLIIVNTLDTRRTVQIHMKTSSLENAPNPWIAGAQYLAFVKLNNDSSILPNYKLHLYPHNDEYGLSESIKNAIEILWLGERGGNLTIPIVLGMHQHLIQCQCAQR